MARKRRTPDEVLADEQERARGQAERVRAARARARKTNADHGAVVARHVGELLIRMAADEDHVKDARAVIDWAVKHMPARGKAARQRWNAPWDPAPGTKGGADGPGEPAAQPPPASQAATIPSPPPPSAHAAWVLDSKEIALNITFSKKLETPAAAMVYAVDRGIAEENILNVKASQGSRWEFPSMEARGWRRQDKRWFAPLEPDRDITP